MTETLDFIIGGMPRGGTTAAGNMFNVHPDSYCYASETHWIPLLMEFACERPVPDVALKQAHAIALEQNRQVLYEMARFSVQRGAHPRALIFEEEDMLPLTDALIELLNQGLYGDQLLKSALPILRTHITSRTGKNVVGEKTPNNVFTFAKHGALDTKAAFMVLREPYSVIRSMHNRGKDLEDVYAGPFRSDLVAIIGIWNSHVQAIAEAQSQPKTELLTYETMLADPAAALRDVYARVGLSTGDEIIADAAKLLRERTGGAPWAGLTPDEQALISNLTRHHREQFGYDDSFYGERGFDIPERSGNYELSKEGWLKVYGIHDRATGENGNWMMREGCLALQTQPGRRTARVKLWSKFPVEVIAPQDSATIEFWGVEEPDIKVARGEIRGGTSDVIEVAIDLGSIPPAMMSPTGEIRLINFASSHSYRSYLVSVKDGLFREGIINAFKRRMLGGDRREVSFALIDVQFE